MQSKVVFDEKKKKHVSTILIKYSESRREVTPTKISNQNAVHNDK